VSSTAGEPLFRVRNVYCRFEDFRRAIVDMAAPRGSLKKRMREDPTLLFNRLVVEDGRRLKEGRIRVVGGNKKALWTCVLRRGESREVIYKVFKLGGLPSKVIYRSISGRSRLYWSRCNRREKLEGWQEGRLYGAVSENSFKILVKWGIIPDYMVPNLEIETPAEAKHIRRLERLIVEKHMGREWSGPLTQPNIHAEVNGVFETPAEAKHIRRLERLIVEKHMGREWSGPLTQPNIHAEVNGVFFRLHFEASEKEVLEEAKEPGGLLQIVSVRDVLGVIIRLEPDLNLAWRVREWPHGILRGRLSLRGLKALSELGILGPGTRLAFNPLMRPKAEKVKLS